MNELKIIEALAAEIQSATKAGDLDRARKLADLEGRIVARVSQEVIADTSVAPDISLARPVS